MKTYVRMNRKTYSTIDDAVYDAERQKLASALIVIHSENGDVIDSIVVSAEDRYRYFAYAVFVEDDFGYLHWYSNTKTQYNCYEEAKEAVDVAGKGIYRIYEVWQTTSRYISDDYVEVVMK